MESWFCAYATFKIRIGRTSACRDRAFWSSALICYSFPHMILDTLFFFYCFEWFYLIWFDLIWFDLIWFDLIWFDFIRLILYDFFRLCSSFKYSTRIKRRKKRIHFCFFIRCLWSFSVLLGSYCDEVSYFNVLRGTYEICFFFQSTLFSDVFERCSSNRLALFSFFSFHGHLCSTDSCIRVILFHSVFDLTPQWN